MFYNSLLRITYISVIISSKFYNTLASPVSPSVSPTEHVQKFAVCPDFYDSNLNKLVTGLGCSDCQYCGDGSVCPACPTKEPSSLPTTAPSFAQTDEPSTQPSLAPTNEPTSTPTIEQTQPASAVCPEYSLYGNLVTGEACSGCDLCGDGSICGACPVTTPQGVCPTYTNSQNELVKGEVCTSCDKCGDGSTCVVCPDYYAVIGTSAPPSLEPTSLPPSSEPISAPSDEPTTQPSYTKTDDPTSVPNTIPSDEPTYVPTDQPTQLGSDVCPPYTLYGNLVTGEACSGCDLCGDGSICAACPVTSPLGVCPNYINSQNVLVTGEVCKGCDKCGDGSTCVVCSDYYTLIGYSQVPTTESTIEPTASKPNNVPSNVPIGNTQTPPVGSQSTQKPNTTPSTKKPILPNNPTSTQAPTIDTDASNNSNSKTINTSSAVGIAVGGFVFAALCLVSLVYVCCFMGNKDKKSKTSTKHVDFDPVALTAQSTRLSASEKDFGMDNCYSASTNTLGDMESARSTANLMV